MERKQEGKNPRPHPEAFTVALGYLPQLNCFAERHGTFRFEDIMADQSPSISDSVTPPAPPVPITAE